MFTVYCFVSSHVLSYRRAPVVDMQVFKRRRFSSNVLCKIYFFIDLIPLFYSILYIHIPGYNALYYYIYIHLILCILLLYNAITTRLALGKHTAQNIFKISYDE